MKDEDCEAHTQEQLASLKRDMRKSMEDATVRAMHKVMAEFEAKSDQRLMKMPEKFAGFDVVVDASLPPGTMKFEQPASEIEANRPEPLTGGDERRHIICLCPDCTKPAQQQEPVAWRDHVEQRLLTWRQSFVNKSGDQLALDDFMDKRSLDDLIDFVCSEYTSPPASKPLTDEQIDKLPWGPHEGNPVTFAEGLRDFARAIEAAHGIKGDA